MDLFNRFKRKASTTDSNISYSQCGEDLLVDYIFKLRGLLRPTYIDIGAYHPFNLSNTAIFYKRGSRGINIEANPLLIDKFKEYRPEDINLNVGIDVKDGFCDFFIMKDSTLSTFSKKEFEQFCLHGKELDKIVKVKTRSISSILAEFFGNEFPDFLSLDVEGRDFAILKSINFELHCPKVICVESAEYSPIGAGSKRYELIDFLVSKGYYEYANTNLNAIMVKNEFWFI